MSRVALVRLLQLSSQALPVGGFSHSQGLEAAIEAGEVFDAASLRRWIMDVCEYCMTGFEIPSLLRMLAAWGSGDAARVAELNEDFLATRESAELRAAAVQMGYSLRELLRALPDMPEAMLRASSALREPALPCVWSGAASAWHIEPADAAIGYGFAWAENQVLAAMKAMPLGQSTAQRILLEVGARIARHAEELAHAAAADPLDPGANFAPGLAILASQHESQYSRLFRS